MYTATATYREQTHTAQNKDVSKALFHAASMAMGWHGGWHVYMPAPNVRLLQQGQAAAFQVYDKDETPLFEVIVEDER